MLFGKLLPREGNFFELFNQHGSHIIKGQSDQELAATQARERHQHLRVFPMFGEPYDVYRRRVRRWL